MTLLEQHFLSYTLYLQVVKLRRGELPPPGVEGDHGGRQRRFRRNQHCDVVVCSDDTVGLLKMKIFERIPDAVPILQVVKSAYGSILWSHFCFAASVPRQY